MKVNDYEPKISVVVPTYNRAGLIGRAIQSVLNQTYRNLELIVVDDASTDATEKVVKQFLRRDARVRYVKHSINKRQSGAENTGIKISTGEYLAFLDDDDVWLSEKLEKQLQVFKESQYEKLGLVYCGMDYISDNQTVAKRRPKEKGYIFEELLKANCIGGVSIPMIKKEVFEQCGLFDECDEGRKGGGVDHEMWIRISKSYNVDFASESLVYYYIHSGNLTGTVAPHDLAKRHEYRIRKFREDYERVPKILSGELFNVADLYCRGGDVRKGRELLRDSIKVNPLNIGNYFYFLISLFGSKLYRRMSNFYWRCLKILMPHVKDQRELSKLRRNAVSRRI